MTPGLSVDSIEVAYGDVVAVWDISISIAPGDIIGLVGRNGVGKSTTVNAIAGLLRVRHGTIGLEGRDITHLPVHARAGLGLAVVPEGRPIFRMFTVERNLALGALNLVDDKFLVADRLALIYERLPILAERRDQVAGSLSGGQQQLLAIAQALMSEPKYLVVDEPTAGLSPAAIRDVYEVMSLALGDGIGVLLVEEREDLVADIARRVVRIDRGRVVARQILTDGRLPCPSSVNGEHVSPSQHTSHQGEPS